ncbi:MAG: Cobalamin-5-phosphate synthase CobS [Candidatus Methanohalarchaeum thermophilum]|uniref:Adenosylcobinamide-GDP ribazoletransferase n=1 Tax=Methanohalarchaeum thermophilum TaxID=1903181 RepID=A0A1Q6DVJ0_METT1|nr:MAG: Cobalamin-5-phosphate synthase CobS [Candidatus Methanohalarchaeum thermophilum]
MITDHLSFFTRINIGKRGDLERIANTQYLFPLIGFFIGFSLYFVYLFLDVLGTPFELKSIYLILFLYYFTGILHLDGLSDLFDGLAKSGSSKEKYEVMKDSSLGMGGTTAAFILIFLLFSSLITIFRHQINLTSIYGVVSIPKIELFLCFVLVEVTAKFSMNTLIVISDPINEGLGSYFIDKMQVKHYIYSIIITFIIIGFLNPYMYLVVILSQLSPIIIYKLSKRYFNGINGDIMGATNEITRVFSLNLFIWIFVLS